MNVARQLTRRLVDTDAANSLSTRMRERRWEWLLEEFPEITEMRVLDIGGESRFWEHRDVTPLHVTMVNIAPQEVDSPWMESVVGDGCDLPKQLGRFDLVFSNSVIEHVGGHWRRQRFAEQVRAAADAYWIQTPNRFFPIEPHVVFPFFQHLPRRAQSEVMYRWPFGNFGWVDDKGTAMSTVVEFDLVSRSELQLYFPDARLVPERFGGLTKSWIAVRH